MRPQHATVTPQSTQADGTQPGHQHALAGTHQRTAAAAESENPDATLCPYSSCPGVYKACGGELVRQVQSDKSERWVCWSCEFMAYGVRQSPQRLVAMEVLPPGSDLGGAAAAAPTAEPLLLIKPLAKSARAIERGGGLPHVLRSGAGLDLSAAVLASRTVVALPLPQHGAVKAKLQAAKLTDGHASFVPRWVLESYLGQVAEVSVAEVEAGVARMPPPLRQSLLPFQLEGVRFGLRHASRCLIGDEMGAPRVYAAARRPLAPPSRRSTRALCVGVGKTLQAIALAACAMGEWAPLLVICPASIRLLWAEELEKWLPQLRPGDVHLITGHADWRPEVFRPGVAAPAAAPAPDADPRRMSQPARLSQAAVIEFEDDSDAAAATESGGESAAEGAGDTETPRRPAVVVCSYTMAANLSCRSCCGRPGAPACPGFPHCMAAGAYGFVIADESHTLRTCNTRDNGQTAAVRRIVAEARKAVLLSGTPSVARPFDLAGQLYSLQPARMGCTFESFKVAFGFRCARRV